MNDLSSICANILKFGIFMGFLSYCDSCVFFMALFLFTVIKKHGIYEIVKIRTKSKQVMLQITTGLIWFPFYWMRKCKKKTPSCLASIQYKGKTSSLLKEFSLLWLAVHAKVLSHNWTYTQNHLQLAFHFDSTRRNKRERSSRIRNVCKYLKIANKRRSFRLQIYRVSSLLLCCVSLSPGVH